MSKLISLGKKYHTIIKDLTLNLVSNVLVTSIIQLLIFPLIANNVGSVEFGYIVVLYGVNNVLVIFLGNTLNNIRLLNQKEHVNYASLAKIVNMVSMLLIFLFCFFYSSHVSFLNQILFSVFTLLANNRAYMSVYYRIKLEYNKILYLNFSLIIGYLIGFLIYFLTDIWALIFLSGELCGLIYMFKTKNKIVSEYLVRERTSSAIVKQFVSLSFSNLISSTLTYLDRFIIVPILGAASMAIFYAASSVSKILTMIITPMTNVMLSYISQSNKMISKKKLIGMFAVLFITIIPCYFFMNIISKTVVHVLYPTLAIKASEIIPVVSIGILLNTIYSIMNPFLLKIYAVYYQTLIQLLYGVFYLILAMYLGNEYGLWGFSYAFTLGVVFKLCLQVIVTIFGKYKIE